VDPAGYGENTGLANTTNQLAVAVGGMALTTVSQETYQAIRLLKIDPAKPPDEQVIELTPAEPVRGRFADPDGKPLAGVKVRGLQQSGDSWSAPLPDAEFIARPPHPDRPRRLTFRHDGRKLVGTTVVTAGSAEPVEFKLEPWASVTGRLMDADGRPVARASVYAPGGGHDRRATDSVPIGTVFTDANGRFTVDGLLPGVPYRLFYREFQPARRGGPVMDELTLKPGQERNLGELKMPAREP
jgi:hypothetical protein